MIGVLLDVNVDVVRLRYDVMCMLWYGFRVRLVCGVIEFFLVLGFFLKCFFCFMKFFFLNMFLFFGWRYYKCFLLGFVGFWKVFMK